MIIETIKLSRKNFGIRSYGWNFVICYNQELCSHPFFKLLRDAEEYLAKNCKDNRYNIKEINWID